MTNIPKARELIQEVLNNMSTGDWRITTLQAALEHMTRKVNKKRVMINKMTPELHKQIAAMIWFNEHLQDSEIAIVLGMTGAGGARVSEIRNGLL